MAKGKKALNGVELGTPWVNVNIYIGFAFGLIARYALFCDVPIPFLVPCTSILSLKPKTTEKMSLLEVRFCVTQTVFANLELN